MKSLLGDFEGKIQFDEARHVYFFDGRAVPSVTQVLKPMQNFDFVKPEVLQAAADFGTAVHMACELDDLDELDMDSVDHALIEPLEAWRQFCRDYGVIWQAIEAPVFSKRNLYAGKIDRFGLVENELAIVDIKTSAQLSPVVGLQLAGYEIAIKEALNMQNTPMKRYAVQLKQDGGYHVQMYQDPADAAIFLSLRSLMAWCSSNKVNKNFKIAA